MPSEIPIQNLYFLLCYAWDRLPEAKEVDIAANDCHSLTELLAKLLANGTQRLIKRGLDRDYLPHREDTAVPRGRMDLTASFPLLAARKQRLVCEFDEFTHNTLPNRILKTTLASLHHVDGLGENTNILLLQQNELLRRIPPIRLTSRLFQRVRLHRNNRDYRFLLNICQLLHDTRLPEQKDGKTRFRDFTREPRLMPALFEAFVKNFYKREQSKYQVSAIQLEWDAHCTEGDRAILPIMRTDVSLWSPDHSIILDCKFYKEAMVGRYDPKAHSSHLYQIYSYLRNAESRQGWEKSEGILLYPANGDSFDHLFRIANHNIRVLTVDLGKPWKDIHAELLKLTV
ncbi:5-methylcytosine restriction system specificity protein McrC [Roseibacillus persicicus]|uniref:5-methylcytosine restriction system specificity protein McrC n=1 Tax=Roseibacillus persicicus TaxID=454148 RepID=UPI00281072CC|nr:hypothetical protein [Roseibacillus persicicus]MDQ8192522.1 hypothetical protein [Roseibacillus persicicus]